MAGAEYELDVGSFELHVRPTASAVSLRWLQRGFLQLFGFNHEEACRLFALAEKLGGESVMGHLGLALALSPNYNNPEGMDLSRAALLAGTRIHCCSVCSCFTKNVNWGLSLPPVQWRTSPKINKQTNNKKKKRGGGH